MISIEIVSGTVPDLQQQIPQKANELDEFKILVAGEPGSDSLRTTNVVDIAHGKLEATQQPSGESASMVTSELLPEMFAVRARYMEKMEKLAESLKPDAQEAIGEQRGTNTQRIDNNKAASQDAVNNDGGVTSTTDPAKLISMMREVNLEAHKRNMDVALRGFQSMSTTAGARFSVALGRSVRESVQSLVRG